MNTPHGTTTSYIVGFVFSIVLTLAAYYAVFDHALSGRMLIGAIVTLGIIQLAVQLYFFLHLGQERGPRYNLAVFGFTAMIVGILVGGSLWIMSNLNYNMNAESPSEMDAYMLNQ